ncbi:MAG TPA: GNAT family N-acetyltransferase [Candidatus Eremiobacteraceae bacterium]|nr:GNAT family N-acetyltransferase [Candidatus Eremiobacteraceae bacterium]
MLVPILETDRLKLRGHRLEDFEACAAVWADPAVVRYISGKPSTRTQSWLRMLAYGGHWQHVPFGYWAVEEKKTGRYIGDVGFADFKRDTIERMRDVPEVGWVLASQVHGMGYATEAVHAAVAWADQKIDAPRTVCMIDPENLASLRVAEKIGYEAFERGLFNDAPTVFLQRARLMTSQRT